MNRKLIATVAAAATLAAPVSLVATQPSVAAGATHVAQAVYGKVTVKHLPTKADLMVPSASVRKSVANQAAWPRGPFGDYDLIPTTMGKSSAAGYCTGRAQKNAGGALATQYGAVAQAQAAMQSVTPRLTKAGCFNPDAKATASTMRLVVRMADQEIGVVYKVTAEGKTHYEFSGAVRVGNRVETVTAVTPTRFSGDVSTFAYQLSLAAKRLHNKEPARKGPAPAAAGAGPSCVAGLAQRRTPLPTILRQTLPRPSVSPA